MTLLGFWGFEDNVTETVGLGSGVVGNATGRTAGGRAWRRSSTALSDMVFFTATVTGFFGVAVQWGTSIVANTFLAFLDSGGNIHFRLRSNASGGIDLYGPGNTLVATSATGLLVPSTWNSIQVGWVINDTTGSVTVKLDSTTIITYSGDTRNAGTGNVATVQNASPVGNTDFDDCWVCDNAGSAPYNTFLGDAVVRPLLPTDNGDSSGWTNSSGNSTNNYTYVDDPVTSLNTTDYVAAASAGLTDLYTMGDIPTSDTVLAYKQLTYAAKSDAGVPPVLKPVTKGVSGTVREETGLTLTTTYQNFASAIETTDPDGNALTPARVNGMQAGVRSA